LLRSIHWFAVSQGQLELENRLLHLTTALESLLTIGEQYSITSRISEGSAVLLMSDYDSFVSIRDFMQKIYKARSNVSHGGQRVTTLHEIHRLRNVASELIMKVDSMRDSIQTREELGQEVERRRLIGLHQLAP
jgi:hypothetical protein